MTSPLQTEVLRRLEQIGRSATASDVAGLGKRLNITRTWQVLTELWEAERVEQTAWNKYRIPEEREIGPVAHDQMTIDGS